MQFEEKKKVLNQYLIQEAKINRLKQMTILFPERKSEYNKQIKNAVNLRKHIENSIQNLPDSTLIEILYRKYVLGKTLEEISFTLNYSKRHIERLHLKALEIIEVQF